MNRERIAWMISVFIIAVLAFSLPGSMAQRDDDYSFVRTLVDIHRQVAANYVDPVDEAQLREGAIGGMLEELDPFSVYVPPSRQEDFDRMLEGSFKGIGIQLNQLEDGRVEVVSPIDGSPAFKAGVLAGDIIQKVNGETLDGLRLPEIVKKIAGPLGSDVKINVKHVTGEEVELTMKREEIIVPTVKGYARQQDTTWDYYVCDHPKIGYMRITQFTPDTFDRVREVLAGDGKGWNGLLDDGLKGLILDLRFNPGGRLDQATKIVDLFVNEGVIVSTRGRNRLEQVLRAESPGTLPYFPMIVLVNESSASASEVVAGSLLDNGRAVVLGSRSYGKGSVQELIPLDGKGGELKLTVAYYYLPSGRLVHRKKDATDWGVQPQIVVPMDPATEARVRKEQYENELFKRPLAKSTTQGAADAPPTTQPTDTQLQQAINTMVALVVFQSGKSDGKMATTGGQLNFDERAVEPESAPVFPSTAPTTLPSEGTE